MTDTRILDASIKLLKGSGKKPARVAAAVVLHYDDTKGTYLLQTGSRITAEGRATKDEAVAIAQAKQASLVRLLGKPVSLTIY